MNPQKTIVDNDFKIFGREKESCLRWKKDIFEISQLCTERSVNRAEAKRKILEVDSNYPDVATIIRTAPGTRLVPFDCLSDDNILGNLYTRLVGLCIKEAEELNKRKYFFLMGTYTYQ